MGNDQADREQRFRDAYETLAGPGSDAKYLIGKLSDEVKSLEEAAKNHATFTENFEPTAWYKLWWATRSRENVPSFLELGKINADHFGDDAGTAYNVGHRVALQHAAQGSTRANPNLAHDERKQFLETAYTMNAFADHFLEDRFASGHLRTPRRHLMGGTGKNLCAKMMHDEDNNSGLSVRSPDRSDEWKVYGDGQSTSGRKRDRRQAVSQSTERFSQGGTPGMAFRRCPSFRQRILGLGPRTDPGIS